VLGDSTPNLNVKRAFLDLDSIDAVFESNETMIALDDNLLGVDFVYIVAKVHCAVVALNHKLGDFAEGCET